MKRFAIFMASGDSFKESTGNTGADIIRSVSIAPDRPADAWRDLVTFVNNATRGDTFRPSKGVLLLCTHTR